MKFPRLAFLMLSLPLLYACSNLNPMNWISSNDDEDKPAELVDFPEEVRLRRVWSVKVGNGQGDKYNRLKAAIENNTIYAASNNGNVLAINRENGSRLWRTELDFQVTGGVGFGGNLVLLGTENSSVIALDAASGDILWETQVTSEVLSTPASNGNIVVVQAIDGKLSGHDARTGEQLWIYENTVPALTLRGESSPLIIENFVIAAFGNGTIVSLALNNGTLRWEERVAVPTGSSEIDRMVDIDGDLVLSDNGLLLVPSYQGYLAAIDAVTGQTRWRVEESSVNGASSGFGNIYVCDERDHVKAYRTSQETTVWVNEQLDLRRLTAPTSFSNYVAVGDFEGYVHLLSQVDGRFLGRTRVDSDGIRAPMQSRDNTLYVYGNSGNLSAYSVQ
ncbi:MAG: outer membrane protein assembly factor BamB [Pseudohongiellaceae bacterium]|jgi:outer membrane protein assembly factor BamB